MRSFPPAVTQQRPYSNAFPIQPPYNHQAPGNFAAEARTAPSLGLQRATADAFRDAVASKQCSALMDMAGNTAATTAQLRRSAAERADTAAKQGDQVLARGESGIKRKYPSERAQQQL